VCKGQQTCINIYHRHVCLRANKRVLTFVVCVFKGQETCIGICHECVRANKREMTFAVCVYVRRVCWCFMYVCDIVVCVKEPIDVY